MGDDILDGASDVAGTLAATTGAGPPSTGMSGLYFEEVEGGFVVWLDGEEIIRADGTLADKSVTLAKIAAANVDGALNTPSLRSLTTLFQLTAVKPMRPPSGSFLIATNTGTGTGQLTVKDTAYFFPVDLIEAVTTAAIGFKVETKAEGVGLVARLGVYEDDGTGTKPKKLIRDYGTVSVESVGEKLIEVEQKYGPGRIWVCLAIQGTTLTVGPTVVTSVVVGGTTLGVANLNNSSVRGLKQSGVTKELPAETSALEPSSTAAPLIGLKVK